MSLSFVLVTSLAILVFYFLVWDNLEGAKDMIKNKHIYKTKNSKIKKKRKETKKRKKKKKVSKKTAQNLRMPIASDDKMPFHSIVIRIVSSYLQVVGMMLRFDLTLPSSVRTLFVVEASSSSLMEQFLLFDCATDLRDVRKVFLMKQLLSVWYIPICSSFVIFVFWLLVKFRRSTKTFTVSPIVSAFDGIISSLMVLYYTLFPSLVSRVALTFSCRSYGEENRNTDRSLLTEALSIQCFTPQHWDMIALVGIPAVFLYMILIPGFLSFRLIRQRKLGTLYRSQKNFNPKWTIRLGFMFAGYRKGYEFWESVVMLRKCGFVMLTIFLRQYGPSSQVVAASLVLFIALSVQLQYRPYANADHNWIESVGLHASLFQLQVGLISNMIGRVDQNTSESPLGPKSTFVVIFIVFASTLIYFWTTAYLTVENSQHDTGFMGTLSRFCIKTRCCKCGARISSCRNKRKTPLHYPSNADDVQHATRPKYHRMLTERGSLKYAAKATVLLKRGEDEIERYAVSHKNYRQNILSKQVRSRARLHQRLVRQKLAVNTAVVPSALCKTDHLPHVDRSPSIEGCAERTTTP
jgi:hypothetical protein